jgi:type VI secretion system protein ImpL
MGELLDLSRWLEFVRSHIVGIIITISALIAIFTPTFIMIWRWRKKLKERGAAERGIAKNALLKVWKAFLRQIPREFRRAILHFPPFVVLGESGTGKSLVISKYTDWVGQAAQFYPSYAADPELQIYLGSRALVQEVPPTLLRDTSPRARRALLRLWNRTFRRREPVVVIALNAGALRSMTPDQLRMQAQTIRGKINILSRVRGAPVKTRLVLTHMDQVEGYLAFSNFLEKQGIPLEVDISKMKPDEPIEQCLVPYEKYLPLALTTLPVKAYMKVLTFLTKAPQTFSFLSIVLKTLREQDPLSFEPDIHELYLTSDTSGSPSALANPFSSDWAGEGPLEILRENRRHRIAAAAIAAAGLFYLGYGYYRERVRWADARVAIERFQAAREPQLAKEVHERMTRLIGADQSGVANLLLPRFFSRSQEGLSRHFLDVIRKNHLLPALESAMSSPNAHERTLFLLGLLYASREDDLARYLREFERDGSLSQILQIPPYLMEYYIDYSAEPWREPAPLRPLPYERRAAPAYDLQPWLAFLIELEEALDRPYITSSHLEKMRATATRLYELVTQIRRHQYEHLIYRALPKADLDLKGVFGPYLADLEVPASIQANSDQLRGVLELVRDTKMDIPPTKNATLATLLYDLKGLGAMTEQQRKVYIISLSGQSFTFDSNRWQALIGNSKVRLLIHSFIHDHQAASEHGATSLLARTLVTGPAEGSGSDGGPLVASAGKFYPDILMKPVVRSDFLFAGKGVIKGAYTRAAYEREIKPTIEQFGSLLENLKLDQDLQAELSTFVLREVEKYAADYEVEARRYYQSWEVQANSLGSLLIILGQMRLPKSSFTEFLQTIAETTALPESPSSYLRPMTERLRKFQYVNRLLVSEKQAAPELDWYRQILGRIEADLEGQAPAEVALDRGGAAAPKDRAATEFEQTLTRLGRLSFAILYDKRDSYLRLVREWLDKVGIDGDEWRKPFIGPIEQMHALGLADIEAAVKLNWQDRVLPAVAPLFGRFPFNAAAEKEVPPLEVEAVLHPNGTFWTAFRKLVGPVCVEEQGEWRPMPGAERIAWPPEMFAIVNHLSRLTAALWGKDGNPRPILYSIEPLELPPGGSNKRVVILSFLGCGPASVFGFNQKPSWHGFGWEWWTSPPAHVGIQLGYPYGGEDKADRAIEVSDSLWSFLRLLRRGQMLEKNTWTWSLSYPGFESPVRIKFAFRENPWDLFNVPAYQERIHEGK